MKHMRFLFVAMTSFMLTAFALMSLDGGGVPLRAQALVAHDSKAEISYVADHFELQQRRDRAIFWGNVRVEQAGLVMTAERMTVAYSHDQSTKINRIDISGGVTLRKGKEIAHADIAVYDIDRQMIMMTGNVKLRQNRGNLTGGRLVIDLDKGRVSIDGRGAGRGADGRAVRGGAGQEGRVYGSLFPVRRDEDTDSKDTSLESAALYQAKQKRES